MTPTTQPHPLCAAFFRVEGCSGTHKCASGQIRALRLYRVYRTTPIYLDKTAGSLKNVAFYAECDSFCKGPVGNTPKRS